MKKLSKSQITQQQQKFAGLKISFHWLYSI